MVVLMRLASIVASITYVTCEINNEETGNYTSNSTGVTVNVTVTDSILQHTDLTSTFNNSVNNYVDYTRPIGISNITNTTKTQTETTIVYYVQLGVVGGISILIVLWTAMALCSYGGKRKSQILQLTTSEATKVVCQEPQSSKPTDEISQQNGSVLLEDVNKLHNGCNGSSQTDHINADEENLQQSCSSNLDSNVNCLRDDDLNSGNFRARVVTIFEQPWDAEMSNFKSLCSQIRYNGVNRQRDSLNS